MIDPQAVAAAHDQMAAEYDQLDDLWYAWLFARLHEFIAERLPIPGEGRPRAVDAGCGTGFQSFLLARAGYDVVGVDLADALLAVARSKSAAHVAPPLDAPPLFRSSLNLPWIAQHHRRLGETLERRRGGRAVRPPDFVHGDITTFDFSAARPDLITCCGSTLSFVDAYEEALARMASALPRGGLLFLEVEQKVNPDLGWPLVDALSRGRLGYEQSVRTSLRNLLGAPGRSVRMDYPFELGNGGSVVLPIWLFSIGDLERAFARAGLRVEARAGVHQWTNLLPSTLLHEPCPSRRMRALFAPLRFLDAALGSAWPFSRLGCSVLYCLARTA